MFPRIHKRFFDADFVRNNVHRGRERCVDLAHACSNLYVALRKNRAKSSSFSSRMPEPIDAAAASTAVTLLSMFLVTVL